MIFKAIWDVKTGNFHSCMVSAEGTLNLDSTGAQHRVHTKITCMHSLMQKKGSPHSEPCFPGTSLQTLPKLVMPLKGHSFFFMIATQWSTDAVSAFQKVWVLTTLLSIAFQHLPPNSARIGYAIEEALFIFMHLSTDAVSALQNVWVLTRQWKQQC